ncbi:unnamed protein product, partial [Hydatigera taeniaeformis]|uniref:USP domain-containing protein n=1 Tax=Hydatigena taeniaeformis TaxID=6205 RepID=A0A0R3WTR8_HYDTA
MAKRTNITHLKRDEFQDVNLSVSQCDSIEDALKYHTQTEMLVGDNQYFCDNCQHRVDATKTTKFTDLPPILTLSLSRFYFNPQTMEACKLDKMCSFPILLDMTTYLASKQVGPITYDLFSIVIHAGAAACGGHYHAYIKDPYGFTVEKGDDYTTQKGDLNKLLIMIHFVQFHPSDMKEESNLEIKPVQTNTNHLFTCYQSVSKSISSPATVQPRAQSQQRPFETLTRRMQQRTTSPYPSLAVDVPHSTVPNSPRRLHGGISKGLTGVSNKLSNQTLPGVKTVPVPLISLDSIDRARSRRKTRVVSTSSSTG